MQKTILVIEDHPMFLEATELILETFGIAFTSALNGAAGIAEAQRSLPDLIVSDFHLPDLDGIQVFERLHSDPLTAGIPFLLMTMDDSLHIRGRAFEAGIKRFALKGTGDLISTIISTLDEISPGKKKIRHEQKDGDDTH